MLHNIRLKFSLALVMVFTMGLGMAQAQEAAKDGDQEAAKTVPMNGVAFINMQRVMRDSLAMQDITKQVEAYRASIAKDVQAEQEKLRQAKVDLEKQASLLDPKVFEDKRAAFRKDVSGFERKTNDRMRALKETSDSSVAIVQKELNQVIAQFVSTNRIGLVVNQNAVVFVIQDLDGTDIVLKLLNEKLPKVKVPQPKMQPAAN